MENKDNKTYIKTMKINLTLMSPFENEEDIKKYNNDDLKMLIKSLQCHRCCLLDKLHEEQKKIDCLDYLIYMLKKQMKED